MPKVKSCYICKSLKTSLYKTVANLPVYKCKTCGLRWVDGITNDRIVHFYDKNYFYSDSNSGYKNYLADEQNHRRNARSILRIINERKDLTALRILDVGCAFGFLLDEARKFACNEVYGVELSHYAYEYAKNKLGLKVVNSVLSSSHFSSNYFDVVFMIGTLEHLSSPKEIITTIHTIMKPGGLLVITTLDTAGLFPLYSIKPPEHLFYFNHNNIFNFLKSYGFDILKKKTYFACYYLYDLCYRLGEFLSFSFLSFFSEIIKKEFPNIYFKIPTNEMIVIAEKLKSFNG